MDRKEITKAAQGKALSIFLNSIRTTGTKKALL
jgi:hypothetical protein